DDVELRSRGWLRERNDVPNRGGVVLGHDYRLGRLRLDGEGAGHTDVGPDDIGELAVDKRAGPGGGVRERRGARGVRRGGAWTDSARRDVRLNRGRQVRDPDAGRV